MRSPSLSKILGDLWQNKTRTLLVVLSIAVGIFALGMIAATGTILSREMTAGYLASQPANAVLGTDLVDESVLQAARSVSEVKTVEGRTLFAVRVPVPGTDERRNLNLIAIPDYKQMQLDLLQPQSGSWPPPPHEVLIERAALDYLGVKVGDTLLFELPDGSSREMRVAGLVYDSSRQAPAFTGGATGYLTSETLEWLGGPRGFNELHLAVTGNTRDPQHIRQIVNRVADMIQQKGPKVTFSFVQTSDQHPLMSLVQGVIYVLTLIGLLTLLLSAFLIVNSLSALLVQQTNQIGIMKAIGGRQTQIIKVYLGMILLMSLAALVIGVPLSLLGAQGLATFIASFLNLRITAVSLPLPALLLQLGLGVFGPLTVALYPIWAGTQITVREALTTYALGKEHFGTSMVDQLLSKVNGLSSTMRLSLRNIFRRQRRLLFTLATLAVASAVFIAVLSVRASLFATLDETKAFFADDLSIEFSKAYPVEQIAKEVATVPGVVAVESWSSALVRPILPDGSEGDSMRIFAPPVSTAMLHPKLLKGRWLQPQDENAIVINTYWSRLNPNLKIGDEISLIVKGRSVTWQVVGLIRGIPNALVPTPYAYVNYSYLTHLLGEEGLASRVEFMTAEHEAAFQSKTADALEARFKSSGLNITSIITADSLDTAYATAYNVIILLLLIMAVLMAIVGGLGLAGTMSMNVLERTRELGVLRALGATNRIVLQMIVAEGVLVGILSWFIGTLVGVGLSKVLSDLVGTFFTGTSLFFSFSFGGAVLWLVIVIILSALSSLWPAWKASRLTVRDVLAYE